ncbi:hypothetical protein NDU88_000741 [Pleurodeles waltl]|uniref:Uncharacterized protein n=1 Tax=Pleurodeles waltl TaxID=8319 RepID=A0AAV7VXT2_PLEWA|nr:hypothetical protein NDU88_000741 [Pleurodeles waltl]
MPDTCRPIQGAVGQEEGSGGGGCGAAGVVPVFVHPGAHRRCNIGADRALANTLLRGGPRLTPQTADKMLL